MKLILTLLLVLFPLSLMAQDAPKVGELSKISLTYPFKEKGWERTSGFGWRWLNGKRDFHSGVDIAAYAGTEVYAAHSGHVSEIGEKPFFGRYIAIESDDKNYRTYYLHLGWAPVDVWTIGTPVDKDKVIGYVGNTGSSEGTHLHFELQYKEADETEFKAIDPMAFFTDLRK
ncbi:MAG: M23 family metallopeptidase [bacterium]